MILEKPLSTSLVDSKKIIHLCAERDITVLVNYWRRFDTILAEWKKQLNNKIGELQFATAYYGGGLMNNGSHVIDCIRYLCGEISDFKHLGIEGSFLLTLESECLYIFILLTLNITVKYQFLFGVQKAVLS